MPDGTENGSAAGGSQDRGGDANTGADPHERDGERADGGQADRDRVEAEGETADREAEGETDAGPKLDRRKFVTATGAVTTGLATAGCTSPFGGGDGGDVEEITVVMEEVYDTTVIEDLVSQFEEDADFEVDIESSPYDTMNEDIVTQLNASSSNYDVIIVDNPWVGNFVEGELLQPLDDRIEDSDAVDPDRYVDSLWDTVGAVDGTAYMLPFYNYGLSMLYRTDVAEENDVDVPGEGMEMGQYLDTCATLTDEDEEFYGAAMQAQQGYKITEEWTNYLFAEDGAILDGDEVVLDEGDSAVTALERYIQNLDDAAPDAAQNWGFNEARQLMESGDAFSMLTYNWMLGRLSDTDVGDDLAIAEVPGSKAVLGAWGWAIPHNVSDARADAAWEFLSWVESADVRQQRCEEGGSPTCTDTLENEDLLEQFPEYYPTLLDLLEDAEPLPSVVGSNEMITDLGGNLSQAVTGNKDPEAAISDAADALRDVAE